MQVNPVIRRKKKEISRKKLVKSALMEMITENTINEKHSQR